MNLFKGGRSFGSKAVNMENMNEKSDEAHTQKSAFPKPPAILPPGIDFV